MRIVSQNGLIDIPYEMTALHATDNHIRMCMAGDTGKGSLLAEYSSPDKTQKAIEMLHRFYDSNEFMKNCNSEDTFKQMGELLSEENFNNMTSSIFRFPVDEEIEVEV